MEIQIEIPKGHVIDVENSDFEKGIVKFKLLNLTYEDILKRLAETNERIYWINSNGQIHSASTMLSISTIKDPFTAFSYEQLTKLSAINQLMNVAKVLNDNWVPNDNDLKYCICLNIDKLYVESRAAYHTGVCFKSIELALQAIKILGEETVKLAIR